jgi:uncharacterized membrane-anchored protein YhcB (DUF1043 family)
MELTIFAFLDIITKLVSALIALGGILAFVFRKWVSAKIDAHFKRRLDAELENFKHTLSINLEKEKAKLARDLEIEKSELLKNLERYKRQLDDEATNKAHLLEKKFEAYEIFYAEYDRVLVELNTLQFLDDEPNPINSELRDVFRLRLISLLQGAQEKLANHNFYISTETKVKIATLYRDLMTFLAEGAKDKARTDELATRESLISAELRVELLGNSA